MNNEYAVPVQAALQRGEQTLALRRTERGAVLQIEAQFGAGVEFIDILAAGSRTARKGKGQFDQRDIEARINAYGVHIDRDYSWGLY